MNFYKKATPSMPSIQRQSTVTRIGTYFQKQNLMPSMPCHSAISCALTRHLFQPIKPLPEDYRLLDRLCSDLRKVVDEKSRVTNQVISCLKEFYPKALETFSLNSQIFIDFLKAFPDHGTLSACTKKTFLAFLMKHRYPCPAKADELWKII